MPWDANAPVGRFRWKEPEFREARDILLASGQVLAREIGFTKRSLDTPLLMEQLVGSGALYRKSDRWGDLHKRVGPGGKTGYLPTALAVLTDWADKDPLYTTNLWPSGHVAGPGLVAMLGSAYLLEGMENDFSDLARLLQCCEPRPSMWLPMLRDITQIVESQERLLYCWTPDGSIGPSLDRHYALTPLAMAFLGIPPVDLAEAINRRYGLGASEERQRHAEAQQQKILAYEEPQLTLGDITLPEEAQIELAFIAKILQKEPEAVPIMLFHGPPGTGKTHAARCLAGTLGRPLGVATLDVLFNKYLGESEKALRQAFEEAGAQGAILLLDEADALLFDRGHMEHSWEMSQINTLLKLLEKPPTPVVLCTNYMAKMDSAVQRRIEHRILFPVPGLAERIALWKQKLGDWPRQYDLDLNVLAALPLTGGLIRNAVFQAKRRKTVFGDAFAIDTTALLALASKELPKAGTPPPTSPRIRGFSDVPPAEGPGE